MLTAFGLPTSSPNYRTCLWLRADRWGFGQEAEATPKILRKVGPRSSGAIPRKVGSRKAKPVNSVSAEDAT